MTTIAIRNGVMAADTMISDANLVRGFTSKIFRTAGGHLLAVCGHASMSLPFAAWIERGAPDDDLPRFPEGADFAAIVAYADGRVAVFSEKFLPQFLTAEFHTMGSGGEVALGAMAMGASAEEAVRVACRFDPWSREPIQVEMLEPA